MVGHNVDLPFLNLLMIAIIKDMEGAILTYSSGNFVLLLETMDASASSNIKTRYHALNL